MQSKPFITEIITNTLNARYFTVGDFYDVTYTNTERYLAICTESTNAAVSLLVISVLSSTSSSSKGRIIIIDNKNIEEFSSIRSFNSEIGDLPNGDGLGVILRQKQED